MSNTPFHFVQIQADHGPSFIWLHGWGQTHHSLLRLAELCKKHGTHTLFDLPGFGQTAAPPLGADTAKYADMLAEQITALGLAGPHIFIGHSFGGRIAVQMAARHPHQTKAIILLAGAGLKRKRSLAFKLRALGLKTLGKVARLSDTVFNTTHYKTYSQRFGSADYKAAGVLRPTFVAVVNEDLSDQAKATACPALLVYADRDQEAPPEIGETYATLIGNAQYHLLQGYGHLDMLDRGAYQCQAMIDSFLKDLSHNE